MDDTEERYRSRKWILSKNTLIAASIVAGILVIASVSGVEVVPNITWTLTWWSTFTGVVLGGYGIQNLVGRKIDK